MTSPWRSVVTARSLLALVAGLIAFVGLSVLRIRLQYAFYPASAVGFVLTVLMYLIPGAIVALVAAQFRLLHGAALGLLTALVVWFEVPLPPALLSWDVTWFLVLIVLFGAVVSAAGGLAARWAVRRVTSKAVWP